jgi:5'/3'-nucleotidase SurE
MSRSHDRHRPRHVLVTNDDGYDAPGLRALLQAVDLLGLSATVVAPLLPMSGASRSRRQNVPVPWTQGEPIGGHPVVRLAGTPAACVIFALTANIVAPVDLCLSGVNAGPNLGAGLTASGTYGAVLEAAAFGVRGAALSRAFDSPQGAASWDWSWVPDAAARALECLLSTRAKWLTANINLPDHGGTAPPAFASLSRASYYRDIYDTEVAMIRSHAGGYPPQAIEDQDDIHTFAEQNRTSITLFT